MRPSALGLLASNALTLLLALAFDWETGWLIWPYWIQSVVIGFYARHRMLALHDFTTEGFTSNGRRVSEDEAGKRSTANFFALHYGFFHAGYLAFLCAQHPVGSPRDIALLALCGLSFVYSQRQTYAAQHAADVRGKPSLGALMLLPYLRILPMHLIILVGGTTGTGAAVMVVFTALKTASDLAMDSLDRRLAERAAERARADAG
ncbi:DUF6498-containing protein [Pseudoxanthomonas putridarboris]|uniref:DUF6498-containing protein n=1 Tax=Pseudoxanthomonas putridarboris TaxID=752605 RepID=A0ABU9J432_9GAMM